MDFSLHERRRLAQIEQELSGDRRLVAMLGILGFRRLRLIRYLGVRLRRPGGRRRAPSTARSRFAVILLFVAALLVLAAPVGLAMAVVVGSPALIALGIAILPLPPLAFLAARRWVRRVHTRRA